MLKATADIDTAITRANREIELLDEYRTRLIDNVVTSKLDVRKAAALPALTPNLMKQAPPLNKPRQTIDLDGTTET